jgi:hypothetical protein
VKYLISENCFQKTLFPTVTPLVAKLRGLSWTAVGKYDSIAEGDDELSHSMHRSGTELSF